MKTLIYLDPDDIEFKASLDKNILTIENKKFRVFQLNRKLITYDFPGSIRTEFQLVDENRILKLNNRGQISQTKGLFSKLFITGTIPEYSLSHDHDMFLINHRCGSSALRGYLRMMQGVISKNEYYNTSSYRSNGWGFYDYTYKQTTEIINTKQPKIFMIYREPLQHFISCLNKLYEFKQMSIDNYITYLEQQNLNYKNTLQSNVHFITQSSIFFNLNLSLNDITFIHINNLQKFLENKYKMPFKIKNKTINKRFSLKDLTDENIQKIKKVYKYDYLIKENFK